jgi:hypothetical protein
MNVEKYYQIYKKGEALKDVVKKYSTSANEYELMKECHKIMTSVRLLDEKAKSTIHRYFLHEIVLKNLLLETNADKFLKEVLNLLYSTASGKPAKPAIKDKTVSYKDFSLELGECQLDNFKAGKPENIAAGLMANAFIINLNERLGFLMDSDYEKLLSKLLPKYKNVYEITNGFHSSASFEIEKQFKIKPILHTMEPSVDKPYGAIDHIFSTKFKDNSLILVNLWIPRLIKFMMIYQIYKKVLEQNKNITIVIASYSRLLGKKFHTPDFPNYDTIFKGKTPQLSIKCEKHAVPGIVKSFQIISNDGMVDEIAKEYDQ